MKFSREWVRVMSAMLLVAVSGCATRTEPAAAAVGAVTTAEKSWVRTELYFSLGDWAETALSTEAEERWAKFLDAEVTPRFPDGLSVVDVYGQWRSPKAATVIQRERSRLLVILHPATIEASAKIDEIRQAWKQAAGVESVLRVNQPAAVSF